MRSYLGFFAGLLIVGLAPDLAALADEIAAGDGATTAAASSTSSSSSKTAESSASPRANRKRTGETQYNWAWLAARYDKDGDERLSPQELPASQEVFDRLDCSWDGMLSAADFDWSAEGALCQQKETAFALFKAVDASSNGRITPEEWQGLFAEIAGNKGYLDDEDLERLIYEPRVLKARAEERLPASRAGREYDRNRRQAAPQPGEPAPDFELRSPDGKQAVRLSALRGKPVVLIFGCYTCGNYRTYSDPLEVMYRRWKDQAEFIRVYVREAHPVSDEEAVTPTNKKAGIVIKQPASLDERCSVAEKFCEAMDVSTPVVVDRIDNRVGEAYASWPDRLYIVDGAGRIAYQGAPGPFGFNPREMEQALLLLLLDDKQVAKD
jgi:hypothetical protein